MQLVAAEGVAQEKAFGGFGLYVRAKGPLARLEATESLLPATHGCSGGRTCRATWLEGACSPERGTFR